TLPLRSYTELTPLGQHRVHAWRPHFRSSRHQHIVQLEKQQPVWTLIITGLKSHEWGFWENGEFIHHEQWLAERQ
ncbi:MAG: hypothetical protein VYD03_03435, partial [Pseudomonadota bacterium]|nr:hypothetical protein [Pseudomonadota bacterium]